MMNMQARKMAQMAIEYTALGGVEKPTTTIYYALPYNLLLNFASTNLQTMKNNCIYIMNR